MKNVNVVHVQTKFNNLPRDDEGTQLNYSNLYTEIRSLTRYRRKRVKIVLSNVLGPFLPSQTKIIMSS